MAERVGFEPTVRFPVRSLSRRVLSTAQPPLRGRCQINRSRALRFSAIGHQRRVTKWAEGTAWAQVQRFTSRRLRDSTPLGEERLQDRRAVRGEDAGSDFHLMVEAGAGEDFEAGADGAAFGIVGAVD